MPPPREQQPNAGNRKDRRRQEPMPGGWLWIVILLLLAGVMWMTLGYSGDNIVNYSDFLNLAKDQKFKLVIFKGTNRLIGEINEADATEAKLGKDIFKKVRNGRVEAYIPESDIKS